MIAGDKSGKKLSSSSIIIGISGKGGGNGGNEGIHNGVRSISIGCKVLSLFIGRGAIASVSFAFKTSLKSSISSFLSGSMYVNTGTSLV